MRSTRHAPLRNVRVTSWSRKRLAASLRRQTAGAFRGTPTTTDKSIWVGSIHLWAETVSSFVNNHAVRVNANGHDVALSSFEEEREDYFVGR